ncbi:MAG TPA: flagellar M-ring protein FliF C-terminal domain-containing protein, partial [Thermoguttaceae bacterium]|nr:flagellar M-ring protein FliF C-terminal domain-containing protein [Thermoguttaceae bacterium]
METVNQTFTQLNDLFRSMSPGSRITAGLLLAVVVVSLGYLFTGQVASPDADLMNGEPVPASLIPAMEAAFKNADLESYEIRGTQILVPLGQKPTYMAALADAGALPPNIHAVLDEPMKNASSFMSSSEREARLKVAKQKFLGMVISSMKGIQTAFVLYETKKKGGLLRDEVTTASVTVTPNASDKLNDKQVSTIRHLVASAIGTPPANVTIADMAGCNYFGDPDDGGSAGESRFVALKRVHAEDYRDKILKTLSYVPGVSVAVNVDLNLEKEWSETDIKYNPKPVAISEMEESLTETSETPGVAGPPGVGSQGGGMTPLRLNASYNQGSSSSTEGTKREVNSVPDVTQTAIQKEGLTPKRVTVSVAVPSSYFEKVWQRRNPPEAGQEPATPQQADLDKIRATEEASIKDAIAILLPVPEGTADPRD